MPTTYLKRLTIDKPLPELPSSSLGSSSQFTAADLGATHTDNTSNNAVYMDDASVAQHSPDNLSFEIDDDGKLMMSSC